MNNTLQGRGFRTTQKPCRIAPSPFEILCKKIFVLVSVFAFLGVGFGILRYGISIGEDIYEIDAKISRTNIEIQRLDREIAAMRNEEAKYSDWTYIKDRIDHYQLGLAPAPAQEQVELVIHRTVTPTTSAAVQTASR